MKISQFKTERHGSRRRVSAQVRWEDAAQEDYELYFETEEEFADSLACNPHAFLVASAIPAMHYGEKRIAIDARICPELRQGLRVALGWLEHWFGDRRPSIETLGRLLNNGEAPAPRRAGSFFSGGIDSYATIALNRLSFPLDHPRAIRDGILVFGLEQDDPEIFATVKAMLSEAAQKSGITLIPVYTNLYLRFRAEDEKNKWNLWWYKFQGAALASVAHALAPRFSDVSISPDYDIPNFMPNGSHPLLEPNYSSCDLRIRYDGTDLSRLERTRLILEQGLPISHLRVCNQFKKYQANRFNCCRCEKCVRTMLALKALGALEGNPSFFVPDVSEEMVARLNLEHKKEFYDEMLEPLRSRGFGSLVALIEKKLAETEASGLRKAFTGFDRRLRNRVGRFASEVFMNNGSFSLLKGSRNSNYKNTRP